MLKHIRRWLGRHEPAQLQEPKIVRSTGGTGAGGGSVPQGRPAAVSPPRDRLSVSSSRPADTTTASKTGRPLDPPDEVSFDPYNTGAFDRSRSWEKISKQRKR